VLITKTINLKAYLCQKVSRLDGLHLDVCLR